MPKLGLTMEEGIIHWMKNEGDLVEKGEVLLEVETDKAVNEVEASSDGVLGKIIHEDSESVKVLTIIGYLLDPGEQVPSVWPEERRIEPESPSVPAFGDAASTVAATPIAQKMASERGINLGAIRGTGKAGAITKEDVLHHIEQETAHLQRPDRNIVASPRAKRAAREHGVPLDRVQGTGPNGRILEQDIQAYLDAQDLVEPTRMQRVTAERLTASFSTVPHFYLRVEADASQLVAARQAFVTAAEKAAAERPTHSDLLVHIVGQSLASHPLVNVSWANGLIRKEKDVHIGLAMALDEGLVVPVIRNADQKSVTQIAADRRRLIDKATAGKLELTDLEAGTFTITNLGMFGIDDFDAIINPPQSAILAVGQIADRVVAVDGRAAVVPSIRLSLAIDHRVLDGATAARFLVDIKDRIENAEGLIGEAQG